MKPRLLISLLCLSHLLIFPQDRHSINGTITNADTGEFLIGANVYLTTTREGTTSNNYGFYSLTVSGQDSVGIQFSYLGYESQIKKVVLRGNIRLNVELQPRTQEIDEVVVSAEAPDENIRSVQMGVLDIPPAKIKELPVILGEPDVLKVIQLLPGVQPGNEGTTAYHVRGGNADQNLILLDEAIVYNPNHLVGLVSTFNSRAINNVSLIKGGFPSQYGGRLSSVLEISMKEGNTKKFSGEGGLGLVSSQLTLEGPIKRNESSFIISGRRTYFDYLIKPFIGKSVKTNYVFYDLNGKVNYKLGENDRIYFSGFLGQDDAFYSQDGIEYNLLINNKTATLRWNHIFGPKLFSNSSLIYSSFDQDITALQDNAFSSVLSGIEDLSAKYDLEYHPNQKHNVKMGVQYFHHTFRSNGDSQVFANTMRPQEIPRDSIPLKRFNELNFFVNDEIKLSESFHINLGVRVPGFFDGTANYFRVEPRAAFRHRIDESTSVKGAYTRMHQFIHQIPSAAAAIPTDIWIPSSERTKPQTSQQYALGLFRNFDDHAYEGSMEFYYKTMEDQILFREGNQFIRSLDVDDLLVYGKGWSYGAEWFLKKNKGRLTGWASYTLAWTWQQFPDLNFGEKFPFRHDRRHNLSVAGNYEFNKKWSFSGTFVLSSGSAYTVPVARTNVVNGGTIFEGNNYIYEQRNNARLNPFHRLNLAATYRKPRTLFGKKYDSEWVFSLYNIYSRQNPYFIFFDINPISQKPRARQVSLLPILPSISYNFKF
ncbi:MAG TPA: TonB-dependent receptor [Eudoraea sp.]|nr:TonB-dependent receptor [Eudoraea sp.]